MIERSANSDDAIKRHDSNQTTKIVNNQDIREYIERICPQLLPFYEKIS